MASSFAQSKAAAAAKAADAKAQATANTAAAPSTKAPRGAGERIQVHGQWTIEVRNRDGSVARHLEFENALVDDGPAVLLPCCSASPSRGRGRWSVNGESESVRIRVRLLLVQARQLCDALASRRKCARLPTSTPLGPCSTLAFCSSDRHSPLLLSHLAPDLYGLVVLSERSSLRDTSTTTISGCLIPCWPFAAHGACYISPSQCAAETTYAHTGRSTEYDFDPAGSCGGSGQSSLRNPGASWPGHRSHQ